MFKIFVAELVQLRGWVECENNQKSSLSFSSDGVNLLVRDLLLSVLPCLLPSPVPLSSFVEDALGLDFVWRDEQLVSAAMSVLRVADIFVTTPPLA